MKMHVSFRGVDAAALLMAVLSLSLCGCEPTETPIAFGGHTQGTSYSVRAFCRSPHPALQADVDRALVEIVASMSTYDPNSALSSFNAAGPGEWYGVPSTLAQVVVAAQQLARWSDGAFDVTVGPLVNAWGFGPAGGPRDAVPSPQAVAEARSRIGYRFLDVRLAPPGLRKTRDIYVDLSAIAQGYTVDAVGELLDRHGCPRYMVEVGGEVRVGSRKPNGAEWHIAVDAPDAASTELVLLLENVGVSTSGDYRDYFEVAGHRYSHTMDPRTGRPIDHDLASVSVISASTMWADGIATVLNVLGPIDGPAFAAAHGIAARFVVRTPDGSVERLTPALAASVATVPR